MMKNCVIYFVLKSLIYVQLLYPIVAYSQNQVTIQSPNNTPDSRNIEPELGGTLPILLPDLGDNSSANLSEVDEKKIGEKNAIWNFLHNVEKNRKQKQSICLICMRHYFLSFIRCSRASRST